MHIAIVSEHYHKDPSGPRTCILNTIKELNKLGHRVSIVGISRINQDEKLDGGGTAILRKYGGRTGLRRYMWKALPVRFGKPKYYYRLLKALHKRDSVDIVLAQGLEAGAAASLLKNRTGVPYCLNPRSLLKYGTGSWQYEVALRLTKECDVFVGLSELMSDKWHKDLDIERPSSAFGILNGVDTSQFDGAAEKPDGISDDVPIILSVGGLRTVKGHHLVFKALGKIRELKWQLLVAGKGSARQELESLISELNLKERVKLIGSVVGKERNWLFRNAAIFALCPIYFEAFGNVFAESQAAGLPVVSTTSGSIPCVIARDKTGFLVDIDEENDSHIDRISEHLKELLSNESLRREMGAAGKERAEELTWERSVRELVSALETGIVQCNS
ncbi:MAG: glycosyltransferase family 4 protein [Planctomycetota bacterium]